MHDVLASSGRPLEPGVRTFFQSRLGYDVGDVRVHTDGRAADSARAVDALAYTVGRDIVFGADRYRPHSAAGQRLLAHELTHVDQQRDARRSVPTRLVVAAPRTALERDADRAADGLRAGRSLSGSQPAAPLSLQRTPNEVTDTDGGDDWWTDEQLALGMPGREEDEAAHEAANEVTEQMAPCPRQLADSDPTPPGWKPYRGSSSVFHCGFRGILEIRPPSPGAPMNECFYDHDGRLVDATHPYAACGGTPDEYDSKQNPISHALLDSGGILWAGFPAFAASRRYEQFAVIEQRLKEQR